MSAAIAHAEKIRSLKSLLGSLTLPAKDFLAAPQLPQGVPRGVIVELLGPGATEWLCQFLCLHPQLDVFWCEKKQQILPTALAQRGVNLAQITFGLFAEETVLSLRKVIQSQLYPLVIAPNDFDDLTALKAFQLFTEQAHSILFLLGKKEPRPFWPIALQLQIQRQDSEFEIQILRDKTGALG